MLYLYSTYQNNERFLKSIVNIMHSPINAMLLSGNKELSNIILSKKIAGQYITQMTFNQKTSEIFDELTHTRGNEFYIVNRDDNDEFFGMNYVETKMTLLENNMLYLGTITDDRFIPNDKCNKDSTKIVVLTMGKDI